jgi:hypothetical protein
VIWVLSAVCDFTLSELLEAIQLLTQTPIPEFQDFDLVTRLVRLSGESEADLPDLVIRSIILKRTGMRVDACVRGADWSVLNTELAEEIRLFEVLADIEASCSVLHRVPDGFDRGLSRS